MAIFRYRERNITPEVSQKLAEINEYGLRAKAMLTALGDYWTNYYRELDTLACAMTGSVANVSKEYTRFLDMVRASNILDIPLRQTDQFELLHINRADVRTIYDSEGRVDYFFVPWKDVADTTFLTTALFESRVVLEKGVHYDIVLQQGYKFYVDLFHDPGITGFAYQVGDDRVSGILLWACDMALSSTIIYDRFGRFLYRKAIDGEQYKWIVSALMRFYENSKSCKGMQDVLNIMYGVPYTRYDNEVVTDIYCVDKNLNRVITEIEDPYICVETDRAKYYTYLFSKLTCKVGDVLPQFSLVADFNEVEDYITHPGWWIDKAFPSAIVDGADELTADERNELMDKILKYNTVHINIGISFDTYQTYLTQVKQFFSIIESGFPVYLYPLVDTFFRAVFLDEFDVKDEFEKIRLSMKMHTLYSWGKGLRFDGAENYYMDPEYSHGKDAKCHELLFDAEQNYTLPEKHNGCDFNPLLHFDGPKYDTNFRVDHANDREILLVTKVEFRQSDHYPWETAPTLIKYGLTYSNMINSAGQQFFDGLIEQNRNEHFTIGISIRDLADEFPMPVDGELDFKMRHRPLVDYYPDRTVFNGKDEYRLPAAQSTTYTEDLKPVIKFGPKEKFPWRKLKIERKPTYAKMIYADGATNFAGDAITHYAEGDDCFDMRLEMKSMSDDVKVDEGFTASIKTGFTDSFAKSYDFSGSHTYGDAPLPWAGRRESFVIRTVRA